MVKLKKFLANASRIVETAFFPLRKLRLDQAEYEPLSGRNDGIVVSMASFPPRMDALPYVLHSLMRQSVRPDKILLVLSLEDFPGGLSEIPDAVLEFQKYGLEIVFEEDNLYCHRKYYHAFKQYPDAIVITVDDDCWYHRDTIRRLCKLHDRYPGTICCNVAARIDPEHFYEYKRWEKTSSAQAPDIMLASIGFAGVLYPPHIMPDTVFDKDGIRALSLKSDDLWLKANEVVAGIKVASTKYFKKPVTIPGSQTVSLRSTNKGAENRNDVQWRQLDGHFHLRQRLWTQS